jgi:hypothetical protein
LRPRRCSSWHRWRARTPRRRAYARGAMRRAGVALPFVVRSERLRLRRATRSLALRMRTEATRATPSLLLAAGDLIASGSRGHQPDARARPWTARVSMRESRVHERGR